MVWPRSFCMLTAACLVLGPACGEQTWVFGSTSADAGGTALDSGPNPTEPTDTDAASTCDAGQIACATGCVDPSTDPHECGACGIVCADGERCHDSACDCLPSRTRCDGVCVALVSDPLHCGDCATVCTSPLTCNGGACR